MNLRKLARGRPCLVRIPNICDGGGETTVLAHIRRGGVGGMGLKPPDLCAVWACAPCHDAIDQRRPLPAWLVADVDTMILAALCRTLEQVSKEIDL